MRLKHVTIRGFKNLLDFQMEFDAKPLPTVLVGRNGTGKSNLLEALIIIFRDLDLGRSTDFGYQLKYALGDKDVSIDWDPKRKRGGFQATVDGKALSRAKLADREARRLPRFVFGYYSGPTDRMGEHFQDHQEKYYRALIDTKRSATDTSELRPLFYARTIHSQFVLLAFFMREDKLIRDFLSSRLRIEGLDSVLFVMRQPGWAKGKNTAKERFWRARGEVRDFLERLYARALAPMQASWKVPIGFRKKTTREHLYIYLKGERELQELAQSYDSEQHFFTALESTYLSELIAEVRIRVKVRGVNGSLTHRELSEGEQQLLMVLGLLRFTREDESLFLLDEPDTHLNPAWSLEYLSLLEAVVGDQPTSHVLIATHDPLVVAGLKREQVQLFERDEESGHIEAVQPDRDPRGMGVAALLTSEIYGLRSQLDLATLHDLDRKRELASQEVLNDAERAELRDLDQQLGGLDFTVTVRDPLYARFVDAMSKRQKEAGLDAPVLTKEQREAQRALALEVLGQLEGDEK